LCKRWHVAPLVRSGEYLGSFPLDSQTVNGSATDVQIGVGGAEDEDQDAGIENCGKTLDARDLDGCNERRGGGRVAILNRKGKLLGVVWNDHSEEEDAETVEDEDTPEAILC
jgi:hypothetical protein